MKETETIHTKTLSCGCIVNYADAFTESWCEAHKHEQIHDWYVDPDELERGIKKDIHDQWEAEMREEARIWSQMDNLPWGEEETGWGEETRQEKEWDIYCDARDAQEVIEK